MGLGALSLLSFVVELVTIELRAFAWYALIYFCVDILEHCRISLLSIVAEKNPLASIFRRRNVVVYILEIYLVTDEIYLKSIIIGSRLDYSL